MSAGAQCLGQRGEQPGRHGLANHDAERRKRQSLTAKLRTTRRAVRRGCRSRHDELRGNVCRYPPAPWRVRTFAAAQVVAPGQIEPRETLPSFHYEAAQGEFAAGALRLPWDPGDPQYAVGVFARDHGAMTPGRLIASAKSWLCHSGVDRTADLLPWHGAPDVQRLSPVEVSSRFLSHIRQAWDDGLPDWPLAEQDLVVTLPASFDEVARELTVKAAARAGLPRVVLIEEPQAAFYAWIDAHADDWDQRVTPGQKILVCDIGGGTSDFTLIRVRRNAGGSVGFHRVSVGDHLILGGDNLDLALAQRIEDRLTGGGKLEPTAWAVLVRACRQVKETLLGDSAPEKLTVNVPGAGSRLIGGGRQVDVTRDEVSEWLLEGFFPQVTLDDRPSRRQSGFQEFGLPFAPDAAVTRYLAAFLTAHRRVALDETEDAGEHDPARPDVILFNGGLFASDAIRRRMLEVVRSWFPGENGDWSPTVLANDRLDLAVAHGAAYYGMVRRGEGVRIAAGLARAYFIGVESDPPEAVCLAPAGAEPGQEIDLAGRSFELLISHPVEFPLFVSSIRLTDKPGDLVPVDRDQMTPLPPIRTVLRTSKKSEAGAAQVNLHARLTEIGTLELWCSETAGPRSWRLQFDVRSTTQTDVAAHEATGEREGFIDEDAWRRCQELIGQTFGPGGQDKPEGLIKRLSRALELERREWPTSLLRRMWEELIAFAPARRRSQPHEARWLNLLGFSLRPGFGLAVDDWRVAETRRALQNKLAHASVLCRTEWWILWRRIAGGLESGPQQALAEPLIASIRSLHRKQVLGKGKGADFNFAANEAAEVWRLLGSLELLAVPLKIELGAVILDLLPKRKLEPMRSPMLWALGRLGARAPVYGPLNCVTPSGVVSEWLRRVMDMRIDDAMSNLAVMQMARRTDDRYRDISDKQREHVLDWLGQRGAAAHFFQLVREGGALESEEQNLVFGEALPKGLRIR